MHLLRGMTRVLILLLILRVLAAPIAARPDSYRPHPKDGFIVRVCAWPVHRSNASAICAPRNSNGENTAMFPVTTDRAIAFLTRSFRLDRLALSLHEPSSRRLIDSPRC
jgi:hypothetical protein